MLNRVVLELYSDCASIKRTSNISISFTDNRNNLHIFNYFDEITILSSSSVSSSRLVFIDTNETLLLESFSDLDLHFLALHFAFPASGFLRYVPSVPCTPADLHLVILPSDSPQKILKVLLFGLRCRQASLVPLISTSGDEATLFVPDAFNGLASLPFKFHAFNRPVPQISPESLLKKFLDEGGVPVPTKSPKAAVVAAASCAQQKELMRLAEADATTMRQKNLAGDAKSIDLAKIVRLIKSFLVRHATADAPRSEAAAVAVEPAQDHGWVAAADHEAAIAAWQRRLIEGEKQRDTLLSQERQRHALEVEKLEGAIESLTRQLQEEGRQRREAEHEKEKVFCMLEKIKDGRLGGFWLKRGTRKFEI